MGAQLKIEEKRRLKRYSVREKVFSQQTDKFLGYAENLHTQGLMIATKKPIKADQKIQIWFGASKDNKTSDRIFVTAYRTWFSFSTSEERYYYSGLQFIGASKETEQKIELLLEEITMEKETS